MTANTQTLLTPDDLSVELGIPKHTLYQWRSKGYGPPALRLGKHLRYRRQDVDDWCERMREHRPGVA